VDVDALLASPNDTMTITRVFGEPLERDGTLVIPVAAVAGGGGGGRREGQRGRPGESGGGFGVWARPIGVYVVRDGKVRFRPALGAVPLVIGAALMATLLVRAWTRRRTRPAPATDDAVTTQP
jgi:uncharacterized spore protein YtfJ